MSNLTAHSDADFEVAGRFPGDVRAKWRGFIALGIALLLAATLTLGHALGAGPVSFRYIGTWMVIGAGAQILLAFYIRSCRGFIHWLLGGFSYGVAGAFAYYNPARGSTELTLLLAAALIVSGAIRIGVGGFVRPGSDALVASGVVSCVAAMLIALGWPTGEPWMLGLWLTMDLAAQAAAALTFGVALKDRTLTTR